MPRPLKPPALIPGSALAVISPSSPAEPGRISRGLAELTRIGYKPLPPAAHRPDLFFSGAAAQRADELLAALSDAHLRAVVCTRGGYGVSTLLDTVGKRPPSSPRLLLGYSDVTALQIFLWQKLGWVTFYGPMVAAGFDTGADAPNGYNLASFQRAVTETSSGWHLDLRGEALVPGSAEGTLLGGCLTLVQSTLGTPWELDTRDSILVLEDVALKPYQLDRLLLHLRQAGKFDAARGILLGDFPNSPPGAAGRPTVADVARRVLGDLGVPVMFGAPIGHTERPLLTLPLGVRARLNARGSGSLDILEPAVTA